MERSGGLDHKQAVRSLRSETKRGGRMGNRVVVLALTMVLVVIFFATNSFAQDKINYQAPDDDTGDSSWPCCNNCGACTRSNPPRCQCLDLAKACHTECKECVQAPIFIYPPLYRCKDWITNFCKNKCDSEALDDE